jgi:DNA-directed RNA polymerase subunit RPC12/RpoP
MPNNKPLYIARGTKMSKENLPGQIYECIRCGAKVSSEELELRGGGMKCTVCGFRALKKIRPPVVKRIQAV